MSDPLREDRPEWIAAFRARMEIPREERVAADERVIRAEVDRLDLYEYEGEVLDFDDPWVILKGGFEIVVWNLGPDCYAYVNAYGEPCFEDTLDNAADWGLLVPWTKAEREESDRKMREN